MMAGTIAIMDYLHRYVPMIPNGQLMTIPTHGDCLAVERTIDGKMARAADFTAAERLEGLEPVGEEFHHRGVMLQVMLSISIY